MKTLVVFGLGAALAGVVGCKSEDQDHFVEQGKQAIASAKTAIGDAVGSLMDKAGKLDLQSSKDTLTAARDKALDLEKQLSNIKAPTALDSRRLEAVKDQADRLEAALTVQNLQSEWDAAVKKTIQGKDLAQAKIAEASRTLREADRDFRDLDDKLSAAKQAYQAASDKVSETLGKGDKGSPGN